MAVFELQAPDGKTYDVDAPDAQSAVAGFAHASGMQQQAPVANDGFGTRAQREPDTIQSDGATQQTIPYAEGIADRIKQLENGQGPVSQALAGTTTGEALKGAAAASAGFGPMMIPGVDKAAAGLGTLLGTTRNGQTEDYASRLSYLRGLAAADEANHPIARKVGQAAGLVTGALAAPQLTVGKLGVAGNAALNAGLYGAGTAAIENDGGLRDKAIAAGTGGLLGAAGGAALGAAANRVFGPNVLPAVAAAAAAPGTGQAAVEAADRLGGVTVPHIVASDSLPVQMVGQGVAGTFMGAPIRTAVQGGVDSLGARTQQLAGEVGNAGDARLVGGNLRSSIGNTVDQTVQQGEGALNNATMNAANAVGQPASPNLVGNSLRTGVDSSLQNQVAQGEGAVQREMAQAVGTVGAPSTAPQAGGNVRAALVNHIENTSPARVTERYDLARGNIDPRATVGLPHAVNEIQGIAADRLERGAPGYGAAANLLLDLATRPEGATIRGVQGARTTLGDWLHGRGVLPGDFDQQETERMYGALSRDMGQGYETLGGPGGRARWQDANDFARTEAQQNRLLASKLLGPGKSDEQLFHTLLSAAQNGGSENLALLNQVRGAMQPHEWSNFAASVVAHMGRDGNGAYSPALFERNFSKLSQPGRNALFSAPQQTALNTAITNAQVHAGRVNRFNQFAAKVSGAGKSDEGVYSTALGAAQAGGRGNARMLMQLKSSVPARDWNDLGASVIARMGRDDAGVYSSTKFIQDHGKLSDLGRNILFSPAQRTTLDGLVTQAQQHIQNIAPFQDLAAKLLGPGKSDESLFQSVAAAAQTKAGANANLLLQVKSAVPAQHWNDFAASVISNLGKDNTGTFSPNIFLSDFAKLSDAGKNTLFTKAQQADLQDLATISARFKDVSKLANNSKTGNVNAVLGFLGGAFVDPISAIVGVVGTTGIAHMLARPATVKGMTNWSRAYSQFAQTKSAATAKFMQGQTKSLSMIMAREFGDASKAPIIEQSLLGMRPSIANQGQAATNQQAQ